MGTQKHQMMAKQATPAFTFWCHWFSESAV
jgi:hypothetical protein